MSLQITVRGSAQTSHAPERATVHLRVQARGGDRREVRDEVVATFEPLTDQLRELTSRGAVTSWSGEQVDVYTHSPVEDGRRSERPVHVARVEVVAEFVDFERMSGFLDYWLGRDAVEVERIEWDVLDRHRRAHEADVRKAAVEDAVTKAQAYADAVRRGRVSAVELADPGMLAGRPDGGGPITFRAAAHDTSGLALEPAPIVIAVEVDGRFTAS